jgi:hypothetical protein
MDGSDNWLLSIRDLGGNLIGGWGHRTKRKQVISE